MTDTAPVLVVGGTGQLGGQVVDQLLDRGKTVRTLVRPSSDASTLEAKGVQIARGDMLDLDSLVAAMTGADAVISSAAGYTKMQKNAADIDTVGNANLAKAAAQAAVRRFVLTSILTADQTPQVPHFWHKKLAEDHLEAAGVPFVALRPGAFLDQTTRIGGDAFATGRLVWSGSANTPLTFVLTADLAGYLAAAVDADADAGERIDIGWDRPVSMREVADIAGRLLDKRLRIFPIPAGLMVAAGTLLKPINPLIKDMGEMGAWFGTGRYVADTTRQQELFGAVPTAEASIAELLTKLGHRTRMRP